jgi:hypothetical protein
MVVNYDSKNIIINCDHQFCGWEHLSMNEILNINYWLLIMYGLWEHYCQLLLLNVRTLILELIFNFCPLIIYGW